VLSALKAGAIAQPPPAALLDVLKIGVNRAMRIKTVVEAGESLKLLGLDAAVAAFMGEFAGRDLGRRFCSTPASR